MYIGRFAPSPTGPLHEGSMVAALASWLDAKSHRGQWLVRMENVDAPRCIPQADQVILTQLAAFGLHPDGPVLYQHTRESHYLAALNKLKAQRHAYACTCTRSTVDAFFTHQGQARPRHAAWVYPRICRPKDIESNVPTSVATLSAPHAWRAALPGALCVPWVWHDRRLGEQQQDLTAEVGDFILRRRDGYWAYQLAVVVDDADQGITHVVRGEDLSDNTPRQQWLQQALGLPRPAYMHTPLVTNEAGEKLSKQTLAPAVSSQHPLAVLQKAGRHLGLPELPATQVGDWLPQAVQAWAKQMGVSQS